MTPEVDSLWLVRPTWAYGTQDTKLVGESMTEQKVALIGAGNIAQAHAAVLKEMPSVRIAGVFDVNPDAANKLARQIGGASVYPSIEAAAAADISVAHVMTPPDLHLSVALPFIESGKTVLIEKPVGTSLAECERLRAAALRTGARIGVNQNFVFNPAYIKLKNAIGTGRLGKPRFVSYIYDAPLRQLAVRQFSHWMFRQPLNILLEQAVHPLSQIVDFAGEVQEIATLSEPPLEVAPGVALHRSCQVSMRCKDLPASLRFNVGANFPVCRMTVVCDDGVAIADMFSDQFHTLERTAYMDPVDHWLSARASGKAVASEGWSGLLDYGLSTTGLRPRSDPFYLSMRGSIEAFYDDLDGDVDPKIGITFGTHLVSVCELIGSSFKEIPKHEDVKKEYPRESEGKPLVTVIGGTGFIGAYTVAALLAANYLVRVMARGTVNLPAVFRDSRVEIFAGDVRKRLDVETAVSGAAYVINLAHGGGGASFDDIRVAMVDSARMVAEVCGASAVWRLVHVGSISGLFLGDQRQIITGETPTDPHPETRNDYARAKALADDAVLRTAAESGVPAVVLRPGLVIGEGTSPLHGGLGFFNNDQYCIGWNDGRNPLPWVLADDCASAIVAALTAPRAPGHCYNLVGDVRPSAREYVTDLADIVGRPLRFVPSSPTGLWLTEMCKWAVKRIAGRSVVRPYRRDILSRGLVAQFDCSDAKSDLSWKPESKPTEFHRKAIAVFREDE